MCPSGTGVMVGSGENAASPVVRAGNHPGLLPVSASFSPGFLEALVALRVCVACLLCLKTAYEVNIWTPGGPGESKRAGVWPSGSNGGMVWPSGTFLSHWLCSLASASVGFACLIMCGSRGGSAPGSRLTHQLCRSLTVTGGG